MPTIIGILIQIQLIGKFSRIHAHSTWGHEQGICPFEKSSTTGISSGTSSKSNEPHSICDSMKPRRGIFPPQTTPCPWTIFLHKNVIEQQHSQPVILGSIEGTEIFNGFIITAKKLVAGKPNYKLGEIVGHFEPQWDVIAHCCEGSDTPNMLDGSLTARIKKPNQTLLWTAPTKYLGKFVFVVSLWQTMSKYWFEIKSPIVTIIPKKPQAVKN